MDPFYAYCFLLGLYTGGYTNLFSKIVISSLVVYMVHPKVFTLDRFNPLYVNTYNLAYPYLSKIYNFDDTNDQNINIPLIELQELSRMNELPRIIEIPDTPTPKLKIITK